MDQLLSGLRAAGEATRLRLLVLLARGELTVKQLTWILGQSQPRLSRHLKLLCDAGLLDRYREGSWVYFRLRDHGPGAALSAAIVALAGDGDGVLRRDLDRLAELRAERARAAQDYFRANAKGWDEIRSLHVAEDRVEAAMQHALGEEPVETLLDLGTGTGRILELFADLYQRGVGLDASREMLACARDKLVRAGLGHAQVRLGDIYNMPYDTGMAGVVVFHQVLHFLDDPQSALTEAARVLAPGGRMLIVDFAPHDHEFLRTAHAHRRLGVAPDQMSRWLDRAGMKVTEHRALPPDGDVADDGLTVLLWLAAHQPAGPVSGGPASAAKSVRPARENA
jgi:ArsR family transcriptional regulator